MRTRSVTASRRRFVKIVCSKHLPITSYSKSIIGSECSMPPSHSACHTKFHPCVASLPEYSERLASEKNTTHLVHSDLLEHATVRKSRCESTGRCTACTGCEFARGVHLASSPGFSLLPRNNIRMTFDPPERKAEGEPGPFSHVIDDT